MKGLNKIQNVLTLRHSYQYFTKDLLENSKYNIEYNLYRNICEEANKLLSQEIIEGYFFTIPYRLGIIRIKKHKVNFKNLKFNYGLYQSSGGTIKNMFLNEHSGNYYGLFYWNKQNCVVKNKTAYCFIPTRTNARSLAKELKTRGKELINSYYE